MFYKIRLTNIPHSSVEDKLFHDLSEAKKAAEATGFDTCVSGYSDGFDGGLEFMLSYSVISGWSK
tara:strand:+ start:345 stop:539 length:195 start_codon:yes stop_codon:yes gene_type:complete